MLKYLKAAEIATNIIRSQSALNTPNDSGITKDYAISALNLVTSISNQFNSIFCWYSFIIVWCFVPVPVWTDHCFTQDLFEALFLLDFFGIWDLSLFIEGLSDIPGDPGSQLPYQEFSPSYLASIRLAFSISLIQLGWSGTPPPSLFCFPTTKHNAGG